MITLNTEHHASGGKNTRDHVFCLSVTEQNGTLRMTERVDAGPQCRQRRLLLVVAAVSGHYQRSASFVRTDGELYSTGGVHRDDYAVRPALRLIWNP